MKRLVVAFGAVGVAALLSSCASLPREGELPVAAGVDGSTDGWRVESARATRRFEPYDWANRLADLRATLITPRLRKAFIDDRADFHGRFAADASRDFVAFGNADEGVDATALSGPPGEGELLVFVAFYASDQKNRDLAVSGSIWDVTLNRGTTRVKPLKIERVRQSPAVVGVFAWIDRYDDLYMLHFPIVDAPTSTAMMTTGEPPLVLEVDSAIARTSVRWTLTP